MQPIQLRLVAEHVLLSTFQRLLSQNDPFDMISQNLEARPGGIGGSPTSEHLLGGFVTHKVLSHVSKKFTTPSGFGLSVMH